MDPVFVPDEDGNYLRGQPRIGDHVPVTAAALRLKTTIFDAVLGCTGLTRESRMTIPS